MIDVFEYISYTTIMLEFNFDKHTRCKNIKYNTILNAKTQFLRNHNNSNNSNNIFIKITHV
jgi:hypothetical protein